MGLRSPRSRLERVAEAVLTMPPPCQVELVVCIPVGCRAAEGRPSGAYRSGAGAGSEVGEAGPHPGTARLAEFCARLPVWGKIIVCHPPEADGPPNPAAPPDGPWL